MSEKVKRESWVHIRERALTSAPSPSPVVEVSEEMVLAGCRIKYPSLFRHGLEPEFTDGPVTVRKMQETASLVRAILIAALRVR